jgi:hypothetical protein
MAEYRKPCGRHGDSSASPEFIAYPLHARRDIHVRRQGLLALSNLPVVAAQTSAIGILVGVLLFVFSVPVIAKSSAAHSHSTAAVHDDSSESFVLCSSPHLDEEVSRSEEETCRF